MQVIEDVPTFLDYRSRLPLIDVRSPKEFHSGHIAGAANVPLLTNAERAEIGTVYKQSGREAAVTRGFALVGPRAAELVEAANTVAPGREALIHCWRGGLRSETFAWLLEACEFSTTTLAGGYKAFRREAHRCFAEPRRLVVLGGLSGTGKSRLLRSMRAAGEQVLDLEQLAHHRGSAFGGLCRPQPTVEQFENQLFEEWRLFDPQRPVWVEDESLRIGRVAIPEPIWQQMRAAPGVSLEVDRQKRLAYLVGEYADADPQTLVDAATRIKKRLGNQRYQQVVDAIMQKRPEIAADLLIDYYDRAYGTARENHPRESRVSFALDYPADPGSISQLTALGDELLESERTTA